MHSRGWECALSVIQLYVKGIPSKQFHRLNKLFYGILIYLMGNGITTKMIPLKYNDIILEIFIIKENR